MRYRFAKLKCYILFGALVIQGDKRGRTIGFPTINQKIDENLCKPANGVYLSRTIINNVQYFGITNVGTQPTVCGSEVIVETNVFDFSATIYGKEITVEFLNFIRPEIKFDSIDELTAQVNKDIQTAKEMSRAYTKSAE